MNLKYATFFAIAAIAAAQQTLTSNIDVQRSTITIHVRKTGILSAAGHDHWISAPIASGTIAEAPVPRVAFTIETAKMTVKPDPAVDAKTQAQIQKDMEEMTLGTKQFPAIAFESSHVEKLAGGEWKVEGNLSLHGVTKPIRLNVKWTGTAYTAHTVLKQTDFAIKPVSVAGGLIKVANELELDFQIFLRPA